VPIVTAGACGCHNNCTTGQVRFSCKDTIWYDAISTRVGLFDKWVHGGSHPGGGNIDFNPNEKAIVKEWVEQGEPFDDGAGCIVPTVVTYTKDIVPIYNTTCKGGACHGGIAVPLDYDKMVANQDKLVTMMNTGGAQGHPGGPISLSTCVCNTVLAWINQGMPK
jgi:(2Fe-2S) ferredoxin